jgi:hypothetical protein
VNRKNSIFFSEIQLEWQGIIFKPFVFAGLENFEEDSVAIINWIGLAQRL